jgi:hypothetical protein
MQEQCQTENFVMDCRMLWVKTSCSFIRSCLVEVKCQLITKYSVINRISYLLKMYMKTCPQILITFWVYINQSAWLTLKITTTVLFWTDSKSGFHIYTLHAVQNILNAIQQNNKYYSKYNGSAIDINVLSLFGMKIPAGNIRKRMSQYTDENHFKYSRTRV